MRLSLGEGVTAKIPPLGAPPGREMGVFWSRDCPGRPLAGECCNHVGSGALWEGGRELGGGGQRGRGKGAQRAFYLKRGHAGI